jgi:hypothetical protein
VADLGNVGRDEFIASLRIATGRNEQALALVRPGGVVYNLATASFAA